MENTREVIHSFNSPSEVNNFIKNWHDNLGENSIYDAPILFAVNTVGTQLVYTVKEWVLVKS